MHPKILVVGGLGNMGSRYCRIFKALGVDKIDRYALNKRKSIKLPGSK